MEFIRLFSADLTASQIALLSKTNRKTINKILKEVRKHIADFCEKESVFEKGEIEMDKSYLYNFNLHLKDCEFRFNYRNKPFKLS